MPRFEYKAVDDAGRLERGETDSPDRDSLLRSLRARGLQPVHVAARTRRAGPLPRLRFATPFRRRSGGLDADAIALLARELATLLEAGLSLHEALSATAEQSTDTTVRRVTSDLREQIRKGSSFAEALSAEAHPFPGFFVGMVRAGEAGGTLTEVMRQLADSLERRQAMQQEIRSAMTYPILVLLASGGAILILLLAVIPEFKPLFEQNSSRLPWSAALVLAVSDGLRAWWWLLPGGLLVIVALLSGLRADPESSRRLDAAFLSLPLLGPLIRKIEAARFCGSFGTLLQNGVETASALRIAARTVANARLSAAIEAAVPRLRRGERLTSCVSDTGILPEMAQRLMRVGEQSGQLAPMLLTVARIYEGETRRETQRLLSLLVPVVTLVLGVVVAAVIGSILSAILSSYDLPL